MTTKPTEPDELYCEDYKQAVTVSCVENDHETIDARPDLNEEVARFKTYLEGYNSAVQDPTLAQGADLLRRLVSEVKTNRETLVALKNCQNKPVCAHCNALLQYATRNMIDIRDATAALREQLQEEQSRNQTQADSIMELEADVTALQSQLAQVTSERDEQKRMALALSAQLAKELRG